MVHYLQNSNIEHKNKNKKIYHVILFPNNQLFLSNNMCFLLSILTNHLDASSASLIKTNMGSNSMQGKSCKRDKKQTLKFNFSIKCLQKLINNYTTIFNY